MQDCRLIGCQEKSAGKGCEEECGGRPSNDKEEKITGKGCNHHEMMVTTEKRNPVNIVFYLSKVISPMFLDSVRTLRFPKIRKLHTRLKEQEKNQETGTPENLLFFQTPFIVHNFRGPVAVHRAGPLGLCPAPFPVRGPARRGAGQGLIYVPRPRVRCGAGREIFAPPRPEANTSPRAPIFFGPHQDSPPRLAPRGGAGRGGAGRGRAGRGRAGRGGRLNLLVGWSWALFPLPPLIPRSGAAIFMGPHSVHPLFSSLFRGKYMRPAFGLG